MILNATIVICNRISVFSVQKAPETSECYSCPLLPQSEVSLWTLFRWPTWPRWIWVLRCHMDLITRLDV